MSKRETMSLPSRPPKPLPHMHFPMSDEIPLYENIAYWSLYDMGGRLMWNWRESDPSPCWLDFFPNRNATVHYILRLTLDKGGWHEIQVECGPLRGMLEIAQAELGRKAYLPQ